MEIAGIFLEHNLIYEITFKTDVIKVQYMDRREFIFDRKETIQDFIKLVNETKD